MSEWVRRVVRPSWLAATDTWPRAGHRKGMPVRGYPLRALKRIALIGEGPGADESTYGYPFVGASGQEVDRHLARVGLDRRDCLVTNYTWQTPAAKGELGSVNPHLADEIHRADPDVIMTLGAHSTRYFLGSDLTMEAVHGIPHAWTDRWGSHRRRIVLPGYHPAAGMHQVELSAHVAYDFDILAGVLRGEVPVREGDANQFPEPCYREWTDIGEADNADGWMPASRDWAVGCAIDTEGSVARPWGLSWSVRPGSAVVLRKGAADRQIIAFGEALQYAAARIPGFRVWLHNSMHDLPVLQALGIDLVAWGIPFLDTMILAYHLCVEPQGLKALAFRHAGMRMSSYQDLVGPYTDQKAVEYLAAVACDTSLPKRPQHVEFEIKGREMTPKLRTPTPIYKRAEKILTDVASGKVNKDGEATDPRKRWYQIEPEDRAIAEAVYGELEEAHLSEVPLPLSVPYAACDADATRRIGPILLARHEAVFGRAA